MISLHKPTLSIDKILTIHYGKEKNKEVEIEFEEMQLNDFQVSMVNDNILIEITKELLPDYIYHFLVRTKQLDGTEEDFHIQFEAKGKPIREF